jgi:putative redox protein
MSTTVSVQYLGDLQCVATHGLSGVELHTDAPPDNQGQGRSFSPTDLVGTAMATCMLTIMGIVARRDGLKLEGTKVTVGKEMSPTPPRRIARLTVTFDIPGRFTPEQKQKLENAAKTCPVHHSLHPDLDQKLEFRWEA